MSHKGVIVYLTIFLLQFGFSCFPTCECPDPHHYLLAITGVEMELEANNLPLDEDQDTLRMEEFSMIIKMDIYSNQISQMVIPGSGFSSAFACKCDPDYYELRVPVQDLKVLALDSNGNKTDISAYMVFGYYSDGFSLDSLNLINRYPQNLTYDAQFALSIADMDSIPTSTRFVTEIYMSEKIVYRDTSRLVNFIR